MMRTVRSPTIAQVDVVPPPTSSFKMAARAIVDRFRDEMRPGDVYLINDHYEGGAHLVGVTVVKPTAVGVRVRHLPARAEHVRSGAE